MNSITGWSKTRDNAGITGWHERVLAQTHTAYVYLVNDTNRVYGEHPATIGSVRPAHFQ